MRLQHYLIWSVNSIQEGFLYMNIQILYVQMLSLLRYSLERDVKKVLNKKGFKLSVGL